MKRRRTNMKEVAYIQEIYMDKYKTLTQSIMFKVRR